MASFIIKNRLNSIEELTSFSAEGYRFSKKDSSDNQLVFLRKQS